MPRKKVVKKSRAKLDGAATRAIMDDVFKDNPRLESPSLPSLHERLQGAVSPVTLGQSIDQLLEQNLILEQQKLHALRQLNKRANVAQLQARYDQVLDEMERQLERLQGLARAFGSLFKG